MSKTYGKYFGNLHSECNGNSCGIKQKVTETGDLIEVERDEYWIPKELMKSNKKYSFKNKTNVYVLNTILKDRTKDKVSGIVDVGDFIVRRSVVYDKNKYNRSGIVSDIINSMQSEHGGKLSNNYKYKEGGEVLLIEDNTDNAHVVDWNQIPSIWKKTPTINKVIDYTELKPKIPELKKVFSSIKSDNNLLNPVLQGVYFGDKVIACTDAHKLIIIPSKIKSNKIYLLKNNDVVEGRYPNIAAVIPAENPYTYECDFLKLRTYLNTVIKYHHSLKAVVFKYQNKEGNIGFNIEFFLDLLECFAKLGINNGYVHFSTPNRGCIITTKKKYKYGDDIIGIIMPIMIYNKYTGEDEPLGVREFDEYSKKIFYSCSVYYDFTTNNIVNADGSVVNDWQYKETKQVISQELLKKINELPKNKHLSITHNKFCVVNGYGIATNNEDYVKFKTSIKDGIYDIRFKYVTLTDIDIEEYPYHKFIDKDITYDNPDLTENKSEFNSELDSELSETQKSDILFAINYLSDYEPIGKKDKKEAEQALNYLKSMLK